MIIKILGSGCANCVNLERVTREALAALGVEATVEKVTNFPTIVGYGVMSTPGLVVDEKVVLSGRVPTAAQVDLGGGGHASGEHDLLVNDEAGGTHHAVTDDGGEVGDLLHGCFDTEGGEGLAGDAFKVDAVCAAGAKDLDDHDRVSFQWWCQDGMTALNR